MNTRFHKTVLLAVAGSLGLLSLSAFAGGQDDNQHYLIRRAVEAQRQAQQAQANETVKMADCQRMVLEQQRNNQPNTK